MGVEQQAILADLQRRHDEATPGPWCATVDANHAFLSAGKPLTSWRDDMRGIIARYSGVWSQDSAEPWNPSKGVHFSDKCRADFELMAAMRNHLPMLLELAEVGLRASLAESMTEKGGA